MKLAIYIALMEEKRKLQNLFLLMNVLLFSITFISLGFAFLFSLPKIIFLFSGSITVLFMVLQSRFILNICKRFANMQFKRLYLIYLEPETFYQTQKECRSFQKIRRNILIAYMKKDTKKIKKGFAYLKEWQSENVMMYDFEKSA